MKNIDIKKVISLVEQKKFEVTCAAFDLADHIFKVEVPKSLRGRKLAVQSISLLSNEHIQYGYSKAIPIEKVDEEQQTSLADDSAVPELPDSKEEKTKTRKKTSLPKVTKE